MWRKGSVSEVPAFTYGSPERFLKHFGYHVSHKSQNRLRKAYLTMRVVGAASYLLRRTKRIQNSRILKKWGNSSTMKAIWDDELSSGEWDFLENSADDEIYHYLEKYSNNGSVLDLGCGSGNTGNEMDISKYRSYRGVDI